MKFTNPEIPEATQKKLGVLGQLMEAGRLGLILVIGLGLAAFLFFYAGTLVGQFVPFKWEQKLAIAQFFPLSEPHPPEALAKEAALQSLAERIAAGMNLDPEIKITVHYRDLDIVNAFAGFAGHIFIFEGLLEKLRYEEEVAALLAHEIGHVKNRHIMQSFSANVLLTLAFYVVAGDSGAVDSLGQAILTLEGIQFTRRMEVEADDEALDSLRDLYGGVGGFVSLFQVFDDATRVDGRGYQFLQTHPYSEKRLAKAEEFAAEEGVLLDPPGITWPQGEDDRP